MANPLADRCHGGHRGPVAPFSPDDFGLDLVNDRLEVAEDASQHDHRKHAGSRAVGQE